MFVPVKTKDGQQLMPMHASRENSLNAVKRPLTGIMVSIVFV